MLSLVLVTAVLITGARATDITPQEKFREAVRSGDESAVRVAIAQADLNARDSLGAAALHDAAWGGRIEIVRILLDAGANPNITHLEAGSTPLDYAVIKNEAEIAQLLLDRGAEVHAANRGGATALSHAAARGYTNLARLLLDRGASVEAFDSSGSAPLDEAALQGSAEVCALLLDRGALLNAANPESGRTPLNEAAVSGRMETVRLLLSRGADSSQVDKAGATPLENAARLHYGEIVSALLEKENARGAAADLLDNAVLEGESGIARLLIEHGADVNALGKDGSTPLHDAALKGRVELAALLLKHGARVDAVNRFGATPLHDAALSGNRPIVELLLAAGAPLNARDRQSGATPLYDAASMGRVAIVTLLLARGANPNLCTDAGSSPLHAARTNNFAETADLLSKHNARDVSATSKRPK